VIVPDKKIMKDVANHLKNFGFDHVKAVTGIDYPEQEKLEVVYHNILHTQIWIWPK